MTNQPISRCTADQKAFFYEFAGSEEGRPAAVERTTVWMPLGNMADLYMEKAPSPGAGEPH